jgi:hypothetical protein
MEKEFNSASTLSSYYQRANLPHLELDYITGEDI